MSVETLATWRDVAIILLCAVSLVLVVVAIIVGCRAVQGVRWLKEHLPEWLGTVGGVVDSANRLAHRASTAAAEPLVRLRSTAAGVRAAFGAAGHMLNRREKR